MITQRQGIFKALIFGLVLFGAPIFEEQNAVAQTTSYNFTYLGSNGYSITGGVISVNLADNLISRISGTLIGGSGGSGTYFDQAPISVLGSDNLFYPNNNSPLGGYLTGNGVGFNVAAVDYKLYYDNVANPKEYDLTAWPSGGSPSTPSSGSMTVTAVPEIDSSTPPKRFC